MQLVQKIESYLFTIGEEVSYKKIGQIFEISLEEVQESLNTLELMLKDHGMVLVRSQEEVALVTHPDATELMLNIRKQELAEPLSKAALETLALIAYHEGATKPEIDFIRGVNSGFMLRNLLVRGLIEKTPTDDKRVPRYVVTLDTLRLLGITSVDHLPHFDEFMKEIQAREEEITAPEQNIFNQE
jgi:segregation and condensation protein B